MKFMITIEEHIVQSFEIEADNIAAAKDLATEKYKNDEFVLDNAELHQASVQVLNPETNESTEFIEIY